MKAVRIIEKYKICCESEPGGTRGTEYVQRIDLTPIQMTPNRKLALVMGRFTAEDAVKSLQNSRCSPELVSVQVVLSPKEVIAPS